MYINLTLELSENSKKKNLCMFHPGNISDFILLKMKTFEVALTSALTLQ